MPQTIGQNQYRLFSFGCTNDDIIIGGKIYHRTVLPVFNGVHPTESVLLESFID